MNNNLLQNLKRARDAFVEMRGIIFADLRCKDRAAGIAGANERIDALDEAILLITNISANEAAVRDKALEEAANAMKPMLRSMISRGEACDLIRALKKKRRRRNMVKKIRLHETYDPQLDYRCNECNRLQRKVISQTAAENCGWTFEGEKAWCPACSGNAHILNEVFKNGER